MAHPPLLLAAGGDFMTVKVVLGVVHVAAAVWWLAYGRRADEQREQRRAAATPDVVGRQAAENAKLVRNGGMLLGFIAIAFVVRAAIDVWRGPRTAVMVENLTFGVVGYLLPGCVLWFLSGRGVERSRGLCLLIAVLAGTCAAAHAALTVLLFIGRDELGGSVRLLVMPGLFALFSLGLAQFANNLRKNLAGTFAE